MKSISPGERVLITGGTGSLGYALTRRLVKRQDVHVRIFSRDEKKQYDFKKEFPQCELLLGDMRDLASVRDAIRDVDVIIHGASLKYVNISELQPSEYITTNVFGSMNLIDAVLEAGSIRHCVGISSDKACLSANTYGSTKFLLEKVFLEGQRRQGEKDTTTFNVARYGNVVGTRGSVVPFWQERRQQGLTLPITNPEMTRFFFTLQEAVDLIDYTFAQRGGVITSKRMNACTLGDLAEVMQGDAGVELMGERPGEKKHELLLSEDEMSRTNEDGEYFIYDPLGPTSVDVEAYGSFGAPRLKGDQLKELINEWI